MKSNLYSSERDQVYIMADDDFHTRMNEDYGIVIDYLNILQTGDYSHVISTIRLKLKYIYTTMCLRGGYNDELMTRQHNLTLAGEIMNNIKWMIKECEDCRRICNSLR